MKRSTQNLPQIPLNKLEINIPPHIILSDSTFNMPSQIGILLCADIYYNLLCGQIFKLQDKYYSDIPFIIEEIPRNFHSWYF